MISLQVTLSDFRCRKRQFIPTEPLNVVLRFGSIKLQIKLTSNGDQLLGGKRILLDLSPDQLKDLFPNYTLGMFIENHQGRFFSILSLEKLDISDIVQGQQVYFYNDHQQIFYSANFSLIFNGYNNPRIPNKEKIQNHKTFDQLFKKPAVPNHQVPAKTLSSFLYSKKNQYQHKQVHKLASTNVKAAKTKPSKTNKNTKLAATSTQKMAKTQKVPEFVANSHRQIQIYNPYDGNQQLDDQNPPMMQFTNTVADQSRGINLLKTQMAQLNLTAPERIKFMAAYGSKNEFLKLKTKDSRNTIIKIQEKLQIQNTEQKGSLRQTKSFKENIDSIKINRDQLRIKAKQEMEAYQGNTNIKVPVLKDGKYELIELGLLNEQEIADFAKREKELQMEEEKKRITQKQLQKKEKQNSLLKKQLDEKERLIQKQSEQTKKQKLELLKAQQLAQQNKKLAIASKINQKPAPPSDSYDDDEDKDKYDQDISEKHDQEQGEQENYYESDFESMSMASAQKKSKISVNSQKKLEESQSYNDYNESYDPDFESYSQSLLGSQQKLSISQISESLKNYSPKRR